MKYNEEKNKKRKGKAVRKVFGRIGISFLTMLILIVGGLFGAMTVLAYGPSPTARDLFVTSVLETSALKFLANVYFTDEEIEVILEENSVKVVDVVTDTAMIQIPDEDTLEDVEPLVIEDVKGDTFNGKMIIVQDPSRVFVGTSRDVYDRSVDGKTVSQIIDRYEGVGGMNAGGFEDLGGVGNGGAPLGIVISQGELKWGSRSSTYEIIGMDDENKLIIGQMTGQEALDANIRDAVSFGPPLIVNGQIMEISGQGGGLNPRTAIGQRADGAMLLLVCDGRQANSLGASMSDIIDVMVEYEAVNAANLDGGSSTIMYYEGELINVSSSLYGPRDIPTAFVISQ